MGIKFVDNKGIIDKFKKLSSKAEEIVQEELVITMDEIYNQSQAKAPADMGAGGGIRGSGYTEIGRLTGKVAYKNKYSAYQEFGTGKLVKIPKGLESYAMEFYVNGKGRLPASPFLFPAFFAESIEFINRLKKRLRG